MKKRIKVINSLPVEDQKGIEDFMGQEFEVVETWKSKDSELEKGQIMAILFSNKDLNPRQQASILNPGEYEFIS